MSQYCDLPPTNNYNQSRRWLVSDLWKVSDTMQPYEEHVERLWELYKNRFCWSLYDEQIDHEFFLNHMKRVLTADLNYAIILTEEDYIMDGVHRLLKCKYLGRKKILCVKFKKDPPSIK